MTKNQNTSFLFESKRDKIRRSFPIMVKIIGPVCNLDCDYCYYSEKDALYPGKSFHLKDFRMSDDVLEKVIKDYIESQPYRIEFIWHGGEPTLLGMDYFKRIIELQNIYANGKEIHNNFQTNGILIDEKWCEFLRDNSFLCGISIDGTRDLHDKYRKDFAGKGSWEGVMNCIELFKKYNVEFNTMSVVNSTNSKNPSKVYDFLKNIGSRYMQFSPIVERIAEDENENLSIVPNTYKKSTALMNENVSGRDWGNFLCRIFDIWVKSDVGSIFVNYFDNTLAAYMGESPSLCSMGKYCGCSPAVEHNGDVYCCDHFVFAEHLSGNVMNTQISELSKCDKQLFFEEIKYETLSKQCKECEFIHICGGDCPKNRIKINEDGEYISVLCEGFKMFFNYSRKYFEFMANELRNHRPPANVMKMK